MNFDNMTAEELNAYQRKLQQAEAERLNKIAEANGTKAYEAAKKEIATVDNFNRYDEVIHNWQREYAANQFAADVLAYDFGKNYTEYAKEWMLFRDMIEEVHNWDIEDRCLNLNEGRAMTKEQFEDFRVRVRELETEALAASHKYLFN